MSIRISEDKIKLDIETIHQFLTNSYWAEGRTIEQVKNSIEHSHCVGAYDGDKQIGFVRAITDYTIFAQIVDLFVLPDYQGKGVGKMLMSAIVESQKLQNVKRWRLSTKDAHQLYEKYGFRALDFPSVHMEKGPTLPTPK